MKLFRYNQFTGLTPLNENLDKAKKFLKDQFMIKKLATEYKFIDTELDYKLRNGQQRGLSKRDFTPEQFTEIQRGFRGLTLTDETIRAIERGEDFVKLRTLLQPNIGYLYNFVYMYFIEGIPYEEVERLYGLLVEYKDLLDKLSKKFDMNFIDESIPNPGNNHTNSELLDDELLKLEEYRKVKKIIDTLPPKLKKAANLATPLQLEQLVGIAAGFEKIPADKKEMVWKTFFGEMLEDNYETTRDGKSNPNFGKLVWRSRLFRFQQMDNPLTEFIRAANQHLEASGTEGYSDRVEKINKVNDLLGVKGCKVLYNEAGIMIVEINSYPANKMLNGHCSHCIVNSESYWNSYLGEYNIQYYIYNFNLPTTNNRWTIGVTIKPDKTYQSGACQTVNNNDIGREFKSLLINLQQEYNLEAKLFDILQPLSEAEITIRKRAKDAEKFIIKKLITDTQTGRERPITAEDIKMYVKEFGADVNRDSGRALVNAVEDDDYERAKMILSLGGTPNLLKGGDSAISKAKNIEMIKLLVSNHAVLTGEVFNNIVCDEGALDFCLKAGADPNFASNLPIRKVCKGDWKSLTEAGESYFGGYKILLKYGVKIQEGGKNFVIKWASEYGRMDIIQDQIASGCKTGFVEAFAWMGHTRKLPNDQVKKEVGQFLKDKALEFEPTEWSEMCEKLQRRGKKPWIEEM